MRRRWSSLAALLSLVLLTACETGASVADRDTADEVSSSATSQSAAPSTSSAPPPPTCVERTLASLTPQQKAAQLMMIALIKGAPGPTHAAISSGYAGSVILMNTWVGTEAVQQATAQLDTLEAATAGIGIWVAVDQEGGAVQQLSGTGFTPIPPATTQGSWPPGELTASAASWAQEMSAAGIDINLAPVADVVPAGTSGSNAPIGYWGRHYGSTGAAVSPAVLAFMAGMQQGGVLATVKHFPGIGRITGNPDKTAVGIEDGELTADDPILTPFQYAVDHDAPLIMMSSAWYPKLDPASQAVFSTPIITGLLRESMGYDGVVISDDVGAAKAVAAVPLDQRATAFIDAGGDVVLTVVPEQAQPMSAAIVAKMADPQFAAKVDAAVSRVLSAKDSQQLLPCSR